MTSEYKINCSIIFCLVSNLEFIFLKYSVVTTSFHIVSWIRALISNIITIIAIVLVLLSFSLTRIVAGYFRISGGLCDIVSWEKVLTARLANRLASKACHMWACINDDWLCDRRWANHNVNVKIIKSLIIALDLCMIDWVVYALFLGLNCLN